MPPIAPRMPSPAELSTIRKDARLTQEEVAARMKVSASKVSRVEGGQAGVSEEEVLELLDALSTPLAIRYREWMTYPWVHLEPVAFDHPDRDAIEKAEAVLFQLGEMKSDGDLKRPVLQRIEAYEQQVRAAAQFLANTEHSIAFIGKIGVGKSSAICTMSGLRRTDDSLRKFQAQMVLEAGAGGITLCEVQIKQGPQYGLILEPRSEERVRQEVGDLAEMLVDKAHPERKKGLASGDDAVYVPRELAKAIRNMANLAESYPTTPSGKREKHDPALDLARELGDPRELTVRMLSNMELPRRDRRELWYDASQGSSPLEWLQNVFEKVNTGKHREVALPQRITVVVPDSLFGCADLAVRLIDTKGIEQDAPRADIERHFDDPRTLVVLCSGFEDAPDMAIQVLLERASQSGVRGLLDRATLLVLAKHDAAGSVKDDSGELVSDDALGYEIKRGQVESDLLRRGLLALPIDFFNAKTDDPASIPSRLIARVRSLRAQQRERILGLASDVEYLRQNLKNADVEETIREAVDQVRRWLNEHREIGEVSDKAQQQLLRVMGSIYASTVRASVRRRGEWHNLDYYYQLGFGARTLGVKHIKPLVDNAHAIIEHMLGDPELGEARPFLKQVLEALETSTDAQFKQFQVSGSALFEESLRADAVLWSQCENRWGAGPGYRDDVVRMSGRWFEDAERQPLHAELGTIIRSGWASIVEGISRILEAATPAGGAREP
ncbi:MAG: helix-turn-helix transcriptional regulator [Phycisphaerales bacterium]